MAIRPPLAALLAAATTSVAATAVVATTMVVPTAAMAQTAADSIARLPGAAVERDTTPMLAPARLAALPAAEREAWARYLEASRADRARDRALIDGELRAAGQAKMTRAAYARSSFEVRPSMTEAWFRGDSARRMAEVILSYQTPSGGWSKHVDMGAEPRRPGQSFFSESDGWQYIATLDNYSTTEEMRFLAAAYAAHGDARYRDAFLRGLDWLLRAQYPNGCWPQVYPLQGGYHDAATFNDDAIVRAASLLHDVARGRYEFVPSGNKRRAEAAAARAVDCIVAAQVVVYGRKTIWGQQHDALTLRPVGARSYEHASLASRESAGVMRFLMSLPEPDARVVEAVRAAAAWFRANAIHGYTYDWQTGRRAQPGAGPLWARMSEIGTGRPIFSNRDGVVLYDYERLTDRRTGYGWYSDEPAAALRAYERWTERHPLPARAGR